MNGPQPVATRPILHGHEDLIGVFGLAPTAAKYTDKKLAPTFAKYIKRIPGGPLVPVKKEGPYRSDYTSGIFSLAFPPQPPDVHQIEPLETAVIQRTFQMIAAPTNNKPRLLQEHIREESEQRVAAAKLKKKKKKENKKRKQPEEEGRDDASVASSM
eukprot:g81686.t1